jgi:hypothetical protein
VNVHRRLKNFNPRQVGRLIRGRRQQGRHVERTTEVVSTAMAVTWRQPQITGRTNMKRHARAASPRYEFERGNKLELIWARREVSLKISQGHDH